MIFNNFIKFLMFMFSIIPYHFAMAQNSSFVSFSIEPRVGYGILGSFKNDANRSYRTSSLELGMGIGIHFKKFIFLAFDTQFSPWIKVQDDLTDVIQVPSWQSLKTGFVGGVDLMEFLTIPVRFWGGYYPWDYVYFNKVRDYFSGATYKVGGGVSFYPLKISFNFEYFISNYSSKKLGETVIDLNGSQVFQAHAMLFSMSCPLNF